MKGHQDQHLGDARPTLRRCKPSMPRLLRDSINLIITCILKRFNYINVPSSYLLLSPFLGPWSCILSLSLTAWHTCLGDQVFCQQSWTANTQKKKNAKKLTFSWEISHTVIKDVITCMVWLQPNNGSHMERCKVGWVLHSEYEMQYEIFIWVNYKYTHWQSYL